MTHVRQSSPAPSLTGVPLRLLLLGAATAAVLIGLRPSDGSRDQALGVPGQVSSIATRVQTAQVSELMTPAGCWVTGDLASEDNPAELAAMLCGTQS